MIRNFNEYKQRHLAFWQLSQVERPLIGFSIGSGLDSWSYWQDNKATRALLQRKQIFAEDINPEDFIEDQLKYLELYQQINDDVCRTAMPLASIPWMEAILGCPVISTETSIKSKAILADADSLKPISFDPDNPWVKKYLQFIEVYTLAFGEKFPVAQSVLRGPSDLACALLGAEKATMALAMEPQAMHRLLDYVTGQLEKFLQLQLIHLPKFQEGYVIGQYEIWAPEPVLRIQEDFSLMYSPTLYDEFLKTLDERLAGLAKYTLMHLHASSLFLIDKFLEVSQIRVFQVTKDEGGSRLSDMLPALLKIQRASKPLILKGRFDESDLELMKHNLSSCGLCLQPVVGSLAEAENIFSMLRKLC